MAPAKPDRTHFLYLGVIVAVILGIAVGLLARDVLQDALANQVRVIPTR